PTPELALPRRRRRGRHLSPAAHRARRDADALVLGPDRPEVPHRRAAMAAGPVRALALAAGAARGAGRHPRTADRRPGAGLARRFGVGAGGPVLVSARGAGDQKVPLVR